MRFEFKNKDAREIAIAIATVGIRNSLITANELTGSNKVGVDDVVLFALNERYCRNTEWITRAQMIYLRKQILQKMVFDFNMRPAGERKQFVKDFIIRELEALKGSN